MGAMIRLATEEDAAGIHAIYAPIVTGTAISFELEAPSVTEIRRRLVASLPRFPWLVCERGGDVAGYAYAGAHRDRGAYQWSVETTVYVHPGARRAGVGRGLYTSLFAALVLQGYHRAFAGITLPNPASVGLHKALGFTPVGIYRAVGFKLGAWHDVGWWQRGLQSPAQMPKPPRDVAAVHQSAAWPLALTSGANQIRL